MLKHLQPLPISEEMLGAYLEGNLTTDEVGYVESLLELDEDLQKLVDEVGTVSSDWLSENLDDSNLICSGDVLNDFDLPEVGIHLTDSEWEDAQEGSVGDDLDATLSDIENSTIYIDDQDAGFNIDKSFEL